MALDYEVYFSPLRVSSNGQKIHIVMYMIEWSEDNSLTPSLTKHVSGPNFLSCGLKCKSLPSSVVWKVSCVSKFFVNTE